MIIAFDLDGTISDPSEGISHSLNYALRSLDLPKRMKSDLLQYIGPPLAENFRNLIPNPTEDRIEQGVVAYREYYFATGYKENVLFPGIVDVLQALKAQGHELYIATSKRTDIAESVIAYFEFQDLFTEICGCGLHKEKADLLRDIRHQTEGKYVMIGDRQHDMEAGRQQHFVCVGVLWGFGSEAELRIAGAEEILATPDDIPSCIQRLSLQ